MECGKQSFNGRRMDDDMLVIALTNNKCTILLVRLSAKKIINHPNIASNII